MSVKGFRGLDRRQFLGALLSSAACVGSGEKDENCIGEPAIQPLADGSDLPEPSFEVNPFALGVASGSPLPDRVILWTRIAPDPLVEDGLGGVEEDSVPVAWEIANDSDFSEVVGSGIVATKSALAHAVHVDADGLDSNAVYYYRFRCGSWYSAIGRTRTAPCVDAEVESVRFAVLTCQCWEDGYYTVLSDIPIQEPDVVLQLGDYIYEYGAREEVRVQTQPRVSDLAGYRRRYALYKTDPNLQAAHQTCPWALVWDDHEVTNNYNGDEFYFELRAAAYQAYYEHLPLRIPAPDGPHVEIYQSFYWGSLVQFYMLYTQFVAKQNRITPRDRIYGKSLSSKAAGVGTHDLLI